MKTYFKSEAPENSYYIRYEINSPETFEEKEVEFWTDDEEEYKKKLGFVERHIGSYVLLDKREP